MALYAQTLVPSDVRKAPLALPGVPLVLWLIAVVNVTNLSLARATSRQRAIAIRGAVGASRGRVLEQILVEGMLLSAVASPLGLGLAIFSVNLRARQLQDHLPLDASPLMRRVQRIPSSALSNRSTRGRIHLRRPTVSFTFRLQHGDGPYIPVGR